MDDQEMIMRANRTRKNPFGTSGRGRLKKRGKDVGPRGRFSLVPRAGISLRSITPMIMAIRSRRITISETRKGISSN